MKKMFAFLLALVLGLLGTEGAMAEEDVQDILPPLSETSATNGVHEVTFSYPSELEIMQDGKAGTLVFLRDYVYVAVVALPEGITPVEDIVDKCGTDDLTILNDTLSIMSIHDEYGHGSKVHYDIVEVGVTLPNEPNVIIVATCLVGETDVYDLLLTVLSSMIDDITPVEEWLEEVWIPLVTS